MTMWVATILLGGILLAAGYYFIYSKTASLAVASKPITIDLDEASAASTSPRDNTSLKKNKKRSGASHSSLAAKHLAPKGPSYIPNSRPTHPLFVCQLKGHTDTINGIVFSKRHLVSISADRTIRLWDPASFQKGDANLVPKVLKVKHEGDQPICVAVNLG
jgi:WD40 repeat protein